MGKYKMSKSNRVFCDQIQVATENLGVEETIECMSRALIYLAMKKGQNLRFTNDEGQIDITCIEYQLNG